jgi:cytochrome P450
MTRDETNLTAAVILIAGSETSATVLCGAAYNLARNPDVQKKAQAEVRSAFKSHEDITLLSLARLPYLAAVIEESLRCFPAVPGTFPRRTGPDGDFIAGHFVPADVRVRCIGYENTLIHLPPDFSRCSPVVYLLVTQQLPQS